MVISKEISVVSLLYLFIETSSLDYTSRPNHYEDLVKSPYFVDKTLMIKTYFDNLETINHTLITCPRKFGKTSNLKMLKFFAQLEVNESRMVIDPKLSKAYPVFKKLQIGKHEDIMEHLAQYPVLYLDLGKVLVNASNPEAIFVNLRREIRICCSEYLYVYEYMKKLNETKSKIMKVAGRKKLLYYVHRLLFGKPSRGEMRKCLLRMVHILHIYFERKVILLVDDMSGTITDTFLFRVFLEREMFRFMVPGMLKDFYRFDSGFVHSAMITGHSSMGLPSYYYQFVKFRHYHFLENHAYSEFFGFTNQQTQLLFDRFEISKQNRTRFKNYYQGYKTRNTSLTLYNSYWVVKYLQTNQYELLSPEFVPPGDSEVPENAYLYGFMHNNEFRSKVIELIEHKAVIPLEKQYDAVAKEHFVLYTICRRVMGAFPISVMFTYIFERGYLSHTDFGDVYTVANVIARRTLLQIMFSYYSKNVENFVMIKEGMDHFLKNPAKTTPNNLRQMKFWFDQVLNIMAEQNHQSMEEEFHALLLASAVPTGNLLDDDNDIRLKTNYSEKLSVCRPNVVVVNNEESFAHILITRFNTTQSVSQIIKESEGCGYYNDQHVKSKKILVIRVDQNYETMMDEKIEDTIT